MKIVAPFAFAMLLVFGCSTQEISKNYISKPSSASAYASSETTASVEASSSATAKSAVSETVEESSDATAAVEETSVAAVEESAEPAADESIAVSEAEAEAAVEKASTSASMTIPVPASSPSPVEDAAEPNPSGIATIRTVSVVPEGAIDLSAKGVDVDVAGDEAIAKLTANPAPIPIPAPAVKIAEPKVVPPPSDIPLRTGTETAPATAPTTATKAPAPPSTPPANTPPPSNQKMKTFAELDGKTVTEYTLKNANGCELKVLNYGCIVTSLMVPDRDGNMVDVALGHDNLKSYQEDSPYFGAMVGRCGNRIANATFKLDGKDYPLAANNGDHSLHGGEKGFDKLIWDAAMNGDNKITFTLKSPDGDEGFPGNMTVRTSYTLTDDNSFNIVTRATTDAPTICNIVHHSYWNLEGHNAGKVYDHELQLFAAKYTPGDETLIPTGKIAPVAGTALDFTTPKKIGKDLQAVGGDPVGYDHNFVVDGRPRQLRNVAKVVAPKTGIVMEIEANQPGVQFYSGNFLDGHSGKGGAEYAQHEGFCLETQFYPDSANKQGTEGWPSAVLRPGDTYTHRMNHKFSVAN